MNNIIQSFVKQEKIDFISPIERGTADMEKYLLDQRGEMSQKPLIILFPKNAEEIQKIILHCNENNINLVVQSGNTGLVKGCYTFGDEILISLEKMSKIIEHDFIENKIICEAGVTLASLQEYLEKNNKYFPLSIGSRSACCVGGLIATNAGGCQVLKYGNMQNFVLGTEAVMADGSIWSNLNGLKKDNSGYKIDQLLAGSEGTLGIVTKAVLKIYDQPISTFSFCVAVKNFTQILEVFSYLNKNFSSLMSSCELISKECYELCLSKKSDLKKIFSSDDFEYFILCELEASFDQEIMDDIFMSKSEELIEKDVEIIVAQSKSQADNMWGIRHNISHAMRGNKYCLKFDISLPLKYMHDFFTLAEKEIKLLDADALILAFGHLGDGNIHYDIVLSNDIDINIIPQIEKIIYDYIFANGGSFSAEHGVGLKKIELLEKYRNNDEMKIFSQLKKSFDPNNILNHGKMLRK